MWIVIEYVGIDTAWTSLELNVKATGVVLAAFVDFAVQMASVTCASVHAVWSVVTKTCVHWTLRTTWIEMAYVQMPKSISRVPVTSRTMSIATISVLLLDLAETSRILRLHLEAIVPRLETVADTMAFALKTVHVRSVSAVAVTNALRCTTCARWILIMMLTATSCVLTRILVRWTRRTTRMETMYAVNCKVNPQAQVRLRVR